MALKKLRRALRLALAISAIALASGGVATASGKYTVTSIEVLAGGKWRAAKKLAAPEQFLMEYTTGWAQPFSVKVSWSALPPGGGMVPPSLGVGPIPKVAPCSVPFVQPASIVVKRNGQAQPGHPSGLGSPATAFDYVFPNVPRTATQSFKASCEVTKGDTTFSASGGATLRFQENQMVGGWNPGLPSITGKLEIGRPSESESVPRTQPLKVVVNAKSGSALPAKLRVEVEMAVNTQTGVVGDIALPGNKPYITWKPLKNLWLNTSWVEQQVGGFQCQLQLPGYLGQARTPEHEPGTYHLRVLLPNGTSAPWRSFQVMPPPAFRVVR